MRRGGRCNCGSALVSFSVSPFPSAGSMSARRFAYHRSMTTVAFGQSLATDGVRPV